MIFIETEIFTEDVLELLPDDDYQQFQAFLTEQPDFGDLIQDTGGLRKIRWSANGKGKRSGVRVIYYHVNAAHQIRLLLIYQKGVKDDLTPAEKKVLRELNKGW
ncbi:Toxin HigB-2 [compost metagenome]